MRETLTAVLLSSCGVLGLGFFLVRRWVEKRLESAESDAAERSRQAKKRYKLNDKYKHCVGRVLFWTVHGARRSDPEHRFFNGELQRAFEELSTCEQELKELDREQLAEANEE